MLVTTWKRWTWAWFTCGLVQFSSVWVQTVPKHRTLYKWQCTDAQVTGLAGRGVCPGTLSYSPVWGQTSGEGGELNVGMVQFNWPPSICAPLGCTHTGHNWTKPSSIAPNPPLVCTQTVKKCSWTHLQHPQYKRGVALTQCSKSLYKHHIKVHKYTMVK